MSGPVISTGNIIFEGYTVEEAKELYWQTIGKSLAIECAKIIFRKREQDMPLFDDKQKDTIA